MLQQKLQVQAPAWRVMGSGSRAEGLGIMLRIQDLGLRVNLLTHVFLTQAQPCLGTCGACISA